MAPKDWCGPSLQMLCEIWWRSRRFFLSSASPTKGRHGVNLRSRQRGCRRKRPKGTWGAGGNPSEAEGIRFRRWEVPLCKIRKLNPLSALIRKEASTSHPLEKRARCCACTTCETSRRVGGTQIQSPWRLCVSFNLDPTFCSTRYIFCENDPKIDTLHPSCKSSETCDS